MHFFKKIVLSAVSFTFFLFLGELALRWVAPLEQANHHKLFCEYDSLLGWRKIPGFEGLHQTPEYETRETFNSKGLRGPEYDYRKDSAEFRILALGDSYAEGYTVTFDELFSEVLERRLLSKTEPGKPVEVINAGTGGYATDQELLFYGSEGRLYHPDLVVLVFCINDVWFNGQDKYWRGAKPVFRVKNGGLSLENVPVPKPDQKWKAWLLEHSQIARRLKIIKDKAVLSRAGEKLPEDYRVYAGVYTPEMEAAWRITALLIRELKRQVEADGARLLVCFVPEQEMVYPERWEIFKNNFGITDETHDRFKPAGLLQKICSEAGVDFLDPTVAFQTATRVRQDSIQQLFYPKDSHWNAAGHRLIGELLADWITVTTEGTKDPR